MPKDDHLVRILDKIIEALKKSLLESEKDETK